MAHRAGEPFKSNRNLTLSDATVASLNARFRQSPTLMQFATRSMRSVGGGLPNRGAGLDIDPVLSNRPADFRLGRQAPMKCPYCEYTGNQEDWLLMHIVTKHSDFTDTTRMTPLSGFIYEGDKYMCQACTFHSTSRLVFREHVRCHSIAMPYSCAECGVQLVMKTGYSHYMWYHRNRVPSIAIEQSPMVDNIMSKLGPAAPISITQMSGVPNSEGDASSSTLFCQNVQPRSSSGSLVNTFGRNEEFLQTLHTLVDNTNQHLLDVLAASCDYNHGVYACGVCKFSTHNLADILEHVVSDVKRWNCACSCCRTSDHYNCSVVVDVIEKLTQNQVNQDTVGFANPPITPIVIAPVANETPNQCVIPASQSAMAGDTSRQLSHKDSYNAACGQRPLVSFQTQAFGTGYRSPTVRELLNIQPDAGQLLPAGVVPHAILSAAIGNASHQHQQTQDVNQFNLINPSSVASTNQRDQQIEAVTPYNVMTPSAVSNRNQQQQQTRPAHRLPSPYDAVNVFDGLPSAMLLTRMVARHTRTRPSLSPQPSLSQAISNHTERGQVEHIQDVAVGLTSGGGRMLPERHAHILPQSTGISGSNSGKVRPCGKKVIRVVASSFTGTETRSSMSDNIENDTPGGDESITVSDTSEDEFGGESSVQANPVLGGNQKKGHPERQHMTTDANVAGETIETQSKTASKRKRGGKNGAKIKVHLKVSPLRIKRARILKDVQENIENCLENDSAETDNEKGKFFRCGIPDCSHSYSDVDGLRNHITDCHASMKVYPCPYCSCLWSDYKQFTSHVLVHVGSKPYCCVQCDACFATNPQLRNHLESSHDVVKLFNCLVGGCEYVSKVWTEFKVHVLLRHPAEEVYTCFACDVDFTDADTYLCHIESGMETLICCPYCPMKSKLRFAVVRHLKSVHQGLDTAVTVQIDVKCDGRDKPTGHRSILEKTSYKCRHCDFVDEDRVSVYAHVESHKSECDPQLAFSCTFCTFGSQNMHHYMQHLANHRSKPIQKFRYFRCPYCLFTSNQMALLDKHLEGKHSEHPFKFEVQQTEVKTNEHKTSTSSSLEPDAPPKRLKRNDARMPQSTCSEDSPKRLNSTHADIPQNVNSDRSQASGDLFDCRKHLKPVSYGVCKQKSVTVVLDRCDDLISTKSIGKQMQFIAKRKSINDDDELPSGHLVLDSEGKERKQIETANEHVRKQTNAADSYPKLQAGTQDSLTDEHHDTDDTIVSDGEDSYWRDMIRKNESPMDKCIAQASPCIESSESQISCSTDICSPDKSNDDADAGDSDRDDVEVFSGDEDDYWRDVISKRNKSAEMCVIQSKGNDSVREEDIVVEEILDSEEDVEQEEDMYWSSIVKRSKNAERLQGECLGEQSTIIKNTRITRTSKDVVSDRLSTDGADEEVSRDNNVSRQSSSAGLSSKHGVISAQFHCTSCSFSCTDSRLLNNHMRSHNNESNPNTLNRSRVERQPEDITATAVMKTTSPLAACNMIQTLTVYDNMNHHCNLCSLDCQDWPTFESHMAYVHGLSVVQSDTTSAFQNIVAVPIKKRSTRTPESPKCTNQSMPTRESRKVPKQRPSFKAVKKCKFARVNNSPSTDLRRQAAVHGEKTVQEPCESPERKLSPRTCKKTSKACHRGRVQEAPIATRMRSRRTSLKPDPKSDDSCHLIEDTEVQSVDETPFDDDDSCAENVRTVRIKKREVCIKRRTVHIKKHVRADNIRAVRIKIQREVCIKRRTVHVKKHVRTDGVFKCKECGYTNCRIDKVESHVLHNHLNLFPYKCPYCGKDSHEYNTVLEHVSESHPEKPLCVIYRCTGSPQLRKLITRYIVDTTGRDGLRGLGVSSSSRKLPPKSSNASEAAVSDEQNDVGTGSEDNDTVMIIDDSDAGSDAHVQDDDGIEEALDPQPEVSCVDSSDVDDNVTDTTKSDVEDSCDQADTSVDNSRFDDKVTDMTKCDIRDSCEQGDTSGVGDNVTDMTKCDVQDTCEQNDTCVDNSEVDDNVTDMTKCDIQDSCEQTDTCVDNSEVGDNVNDMTKCDVQDNCEQSDTCVDNSGVDNNVTDMTKSDIEDSCEESDTCVDNSTVDDNVTDVTKADIQDSCEVDTCVDNSEIDDKVTDMTKCDFQDTCEQSDTCVDNSRVDDNVTDTTKSDVEDSCDQGETSVDVSGFVDKVTDMTKSDVQDSCEQNDTCVDNSGVDDNVSDMTKCNVQDSCEESDTCVDNSGIDDKVTDMTKSDVKDSCEETDTCVDNSGLDDNVTSMTKCDFQDSCEQSDTCVDNSTVDDDVTDMTKSDVLDNCEQSHTCVNNSGVGDNVTDMTKCDVQDTCEQSDTCVDNSRVDDNVTGMTKSDVEDSCEQSDTRVDNSTLGDNVTDMTKSDIEDSCEQSDNFVDNSTVDDNVTDMTKSNMQDSCEQSDTFGNSSTDDDKVTDMTKFDGEDSCEQNDTRVDNSGVDDNVTEMTKFEVQDSCEQGDTCVDTSTVGDDVTNMTKSDTEDSCEQSDTCGDNSAVDDNVTNMTKCDVQDICQQGDTYVDSSGVDEKVTDMIKSNIQDSCGESDTFFDNSTADDKVTDMAKLDIQDSCEQSDTRVDNSRVDDKVTDMTKSDVEDSCEQSDNFVDNSTVDDNVTDMTNCDVQDNCEQSDTCVDNSGFDDKVTDMTKM